MSQSRPPVAYWQSWSASQAGDSALVALALGLVIESQFLSSKRNTLCNISTLDSCY